MAIAAMTPMIATTISSSMSVNPLRDATVIGCSSQDLCAACPPLSSRVAAGWARPNRRRMARSCRSGCAALLDEDGGGRSGADIWHQPDERGRRLVDGTGGIRGEVPLTGRPERLGI